MASDVKRAYTSYKRPAMMLQKSLCIGVLVGLLISLYRIALEKAEEITFWVYAYIRTNVLRITLWAVILVLLSLFVGWLSKKYSLIGGSGIPQVKGIIQGYFEDTWLATMIAKFVGGFLSIVAGLSLGREGPSIQLGACVADGFAQKTGSTNTERKILMASGASAGLASAFGAPLAAVLFAVEELFGYISPASLISTTVAAVAAQWVAGSFFGLSPVFHFETVAALQLRYYAFLPFVGIALGLAGSFYNWFILKSQSFYAKLPFAKGITKPLYAFLFAGFIGLVFPVVLGGGHEVLQHIEADTSLKILLAIFVVKFIFSMISFSSGAPGGIFFPLLILGAIIGAVAAKFAISVLGMSPELFNNIVIYSMAGFFTAIVRAPLTGIILLLEMTGSFAQLLPFTIVALAAYLTASTLKSAPIYESLLERILESRGIDESARDAGQKTMFKVIVERGALADGYAVKDLPFLKGSLLISIERGGKELTPHGETKVLADDHLLILCDKRAEHKLRIAFEEMIRSRIQI